MNPEQQIKELQRQVETLARRLDALSQPNTIPFEVENAFQSRGFVEGQINTPGFNPPTYILTIDTSVPQTVDVMGLPVRWLTLKGNEGVGLQIPLYAFADFP